ncbi:DUF1294 domain-containing protein [Cohnella zeiphila]|uniref:DUF1294 domain-containing protein n=1 Tax=Cohnella zeiphila TaxID=2761120 RepID=A0A7X0SQR8_9BACL|nr:DUF1294 domain-containing protein [Cohnella zeiphila]MBB6734356.1 DUF1294 domain-containing protein [Cohnella zeiphila]
MMLAIYLLLINVIAFGMMANDKRRAVAGRGRRRIPEKNLFLAAALGGALGAWIGMRVCRHKTKHASFVVGIPALLVLNILCVWLIERA